MPGSLVGGHVRNPGSAHMDQVNFLATLAFAYGLAFLLRELCERARLPGLTGEIAAGVLLGPAVFGIADPGAESLQTLAELGVVFLLFSSGLQTDVRELRRTGRIALQVGASGVVLPFLLGAGLMLLTGRGGAEALFMGTALVATSVGVTAQVLEDLGALKTRAARVILGAAVVDDVLALALLAAVSSLAAGSFSPIALLGLAAGGVSFLLLIGTVGRRLASSLLPYIRKLRTREGALSVAILVALGLAASASSVGLAPIIGAFLAGTIIGEFTPEENQVRARTGPLTTLLVPFFFIQVGAQLRLTAFESVAGGLLALGVIVVAVLGKLVACGLAAHRLGRRGAAVVAVGMVPRGEVGIIVASLGLSLGVIGPDLYDIVVLMSIVTAILACIALPRVSGPRDARFIDLG